MIYEVATQKSGIIRKSAAVFLVFVFFVTPMMPVFAATAQTQQPAPTVTNYTYDPSGQRITVFSGSTTTVYPTKNYNTDGTTTTKHVFVNGTDTATIQGTGANAKTYYSHTDSLNSSTIMTDSVGTIAETMDYYPFGALRIDNKTGTFNEQRKYIGQEFDADTSLNYLNARYYNSSLAKFISQDPVFSAIGDNNQIKRIAGKSQQEILADPQSLNSYSYANNNPITKSDPSGQCPICAVGIGILAMYAPQITNFAQSLLTPMGQLSINQATEDAKQGNYGWSAFGLATAGEVPVTNAAKGLKIPEGLSLGQDFGRVGKVIENSSGKITGFVSDFTLNPHHGLMRVIERGVSPKLLLDTVKNPLVTLMQENGKIARLTDQAMVVLDKAGKTVTSYTKNEFGSTVKSILKSIGK